MSRNKRETVYLSGKIYWAKIFGAPRTNYNEDGREWVFEFEPDEESIQVLKDHGLEDRLKDGRKKNGEMRPGYEDRPLFIYLKRDEFDYEGKPNEHIRVVDAANATWDDNVKLGNQTLVDVKVNIVDYGRGKFKGIYPQAIRVLELVPYESEEFAPLPKDDPRVQKARERAPTATPDFEKDFGLEQEKPALTDQAPDNGEPVEQDDLNDDVPL